MISNEEAHAGYKYSPAKINPYLKWIAPTMKGVKKASKKFQSQLAVVANAPCLARVLVGKVSPIRIQIPGAQVDAYLEKWFSLEYKEVLQEQRLTLG